MTQARVSCTRFWCRGRERAVACSAWVCIGTGWVMLFWRWLFQGEAREQESGSLTSNANMGRTNMNNKHEFVVIFSLNYGHWLYPWKIRFRRDEKGRTDFTKGLLEIHISNLWSGKINAPGCSSGKGHVQNQIDYYLWNAWWRKSGWKYLVIRGGAWRKKTLFSLRLVSGVREMVVNRCALALKGSHGNLGDRR